MKKMCPICTTIEYSYGIGDIGGDGGVLLETSAAVPGLVFKCTKCGHKIGSVGSGILTFGLTIFGVSIGLYFFFTYIFIIPAIFAFVVLILFFAIPPFIGPFLYLPFVNYKKVHENCHYHGVPYETMRREEPYNR